MILKVIRIGVAVQGVLENGNFHCNYQFAGEGPYEGD